MDDGGIRAEHECVHTQYHVFTHTLVVLTDVLNDTHLGFESMAIAYADYALGSFVVAPVYVCLPAPLATLSCPRQHLHAWAAVHDVCGGGSVHAIHRGLYQAQRRAHPACIGTDGVCRHVHVGLRGMCVLGMVCGID